MRLLHYDYNLLVNFIKIVKLLRKGDCRNLIMLSVENRAPECDFTNIFCAELLSDIECEM